jgi:hypothetical protein
MNKNTKMIIGTVLLVGGLYAASKTDNKKIEVIKDDVGNRTLSFIIAGIGAYIIYKSTK